MSIDEMRDRFASCSSEEAERSYACFKDRVTEKYGSDESIDTDQLVSDIVRILDNPIQELINGVSGTSSVGVIKGAVEHFKDKHDEMKKNPLFSIGMGYLAAKPEIGFAVGKACRSVSDLFGKEISLT